MKYLQKSKNPLEYQKGIKNARKWLMILRMDWSRYENILSQKSKIHNKCMYLCILYKCRYTRPRQGRSSTERIETPKKTKRCVGNRKMTWTSAVKIQLNNKKLITTQKKKRINRATYKLIVHNKTKTKINTTLKFKNNYPESNNV